MWLARNDEPNAPNEEPFIYDLDVDATMIMASLVGDSLARAPPRLRPRASLPSVHNEGKQATQYVGLRTVSGAIKHVRNDAGFVSCRIAYPSS